MKTTNTSITTMFENTIRTVQELSNSDIAFPIYITAIEQAQYVLASDGGIAASAVKAEQQGTNLAISVEGIEATGPQVIIENFFALPGQLVTSDSSTGITLENSTANYSVVIESSAPVQTASNLQNESPTDGENYIFAESMSTADKSASPQSPSAATIKVAEPHVLFANEKPAIDKITDDVGQPYDVPIENKGVTNDTTPTLSGTGVYGQVVHVYDNNDYLGSVSVKSHGGWNFTPTTPLPDGEYNFKIQLANPDGTTSDFSEIYQITIDADIPLPPSISNIYDDHGTLTGTLPSGSATSDSKPEISGQGEANATIIIRDNNKVIGTTQAGADGSWTFTPTTPLSDGLHNITAANVDAALNESSPSENFSFTVDTTPPDAPVITSLYDNKGNNVGEILPNGVTDENTPLISGKAEPGSTVTIWIDDIEWDIATVGDDGLWSYTPDVPFPDGVHSLTAYATDKVGNTSAISEAFTFTIDSTAAVISIGNVYDDAGPNHGVIASGDLTDDSTPRLTGQATANCIVKIYNGDQLLGQTQAGPTGRWNFTPETPLPDGAYSLTATVTTPGGGESKHTSPFTFTVDATAPDKPTIESVYDDKGLVVGDIHHNGTTDDDMPLIRGTAEPNSKITIMNNGNVLDIVDVNSEGNWSFTPTTPFAKGSHNLTVIATDTADNNSAESDVFTFTIDTSIPTVSITSVLDDTGDVTEAIIPGSITGDATPTLNGVATANAIVKIYNGTTLLGEITATRNGTWSFTPPSDLPDGVYNLTATVTTEAYGESARTPAFNLEIDTTAPTLPDSGHFIDTIWDDVEAIVGDVANGKSTNDTTPTLIGRAEPNSTVNIYDNTKFLGSADVDAAGNWNFTPDTPLADGSHSFTITNQDSIGNISEESEPYIITVDTVAPTLPEGGNPIDEVIDNTGPVTGPIDSGSTTDENKPVFNGSGNPGESITIYDNGVAIGEVQVDGSGKWTFTPKEPLDEGYHDIKTTITDEAGNTSKPIDGIEIIVDTSESQAPTLDGVLDDKGSLTGPLEKNGLTDDARPTVTGTAKAGTTVNLYNGETLLGTAKADADGKWSITPSVDLADGLNNLTATSTNAAGNESARSEAFPITVDTIAPPAVSDVLLTDNAGQIQGAIKPGASTDDNTPTVSGKAEAGSTVVIFDNSAEIGRATVDSQGTWSFTPSTPLTNGDHTLSTQVIDKAGNESAQTETITFNVDTTPLAVSITSVNDNVGSKTGDLLNNAVTDDSTPTISGRATAGGTVSIYNGSNLLGEVTADADGNWSFTPTTPLQDGIYNFSATVSTAVHGESTASGTFTITVDTIAPTLPENGKAIDEILDNTGPVTGPIENGTTTDEKTPTFNGKAGPGETITIIDNNKPIGEVQADGNGNWTFTPVEQLDDGLHNIGIIISDEAGNKSDILGDYHFIVDTSTSTTPTIDKVLDNVGRTTGALTSGDVTDDAKPTLSGTADPDSTVVIFNKGSEIGRATADSSGNWSFEPVLPLLNGEHALTVMGINTSGKPSEVSDSFVINVMVGGIPGAPAITGVIDDVGEHTGALQKEDFTDDTRPTIEGTALPGYIVSIYNNGELLGKTESNASGHWSFTPTDDLAEGIHLLTATSRNGEGPESVSTGAFTIIVDTTAPSQPEITSVFDDQGVTGNINQNSTTDDNKPTFSGKAEAWSWVTINDGGNTLGKAIVNGDGLWTFTPGKALNDGPHSISVTVQDDAGNTSVASDAWNFYVNTAPQAAVALETETNTEATAVIDSHEPVLPVSLSDVLADSEEMLFTEAAQAEAEPAAPLNLESMLNETGDIQTYTTLDGIAAESYSQPAHIEEDLQA